MASEFAEGLSGASGKKMDVRVGPAVRTDLRAWSGRSAHSGPYDR
jgi:hypothetical protein